MTEPQDNSTQGATTDPSDWVPDDSPIRGRPYDPETGLLLPGSEEEAMALALEAQRAEREDRARRAQQPFGKVGQHPHLAGALARAKAVFEPIPRNKTVRVQTRTGGSYEFKYATLDAILAAITPALSQNGLSLLQDIDETDGIRVLTTILHESGEYVTLAPVRVMVSGEDVTAQQVGSALTYAQRYSLRLALVLGTDEDDDANSAAGNVAQIVREAPVKPRRVSDSVSDAITRAIMACGSLDELQNYWLSLSTAERAEHSAAKDLRKSQLT